jgi:ABC-type nickel/cobalt efflux system permease component RcnA
MTTRVLRATLMALALVAVAFPVSAHPLGNATANRAVAVTVFPGELRILHVLDLAEIPAYAALLEMDTDLDGRQSATEKSRWAATACDTAMGSLELLLDEARLRPAMAGPPRLTFPPGVGGLETLRLECRLSAPLTGRTEAHDLAVTDTADDGRRGWREISVSAGDGVRLVASDVPTASPSSLLTAYPEAGLVAPIDIRVANVEFRSTGSGSSSPTPTPSQDAAPPSSGAPSDPLADLLAATDSPINGLLALALAGALGAGHALSPGHGKALIAAYLVGSRGTLRRAGALGLAVAVSHTLGVFLLGGIVLSASEVLVPDRAVAWLSLASGVVVVLLGAATARRALLERTHTPGHHRRDHHDHGPSSPHRHVHAALAPTTPHRHPPIREVVTLGLAGGLVPSTSALIVLLVALTTGRLVEGMALIGAFGLGMAMVLAGLAAATGLARNRLADSPHLAAVPGLRRIAVAVPLVSAAMIMVAGAVAAIGAIGSF